MQNFLPMAELPDLKRVAPFYYQWLAHPPASDWWDWAELRGQNDRVHAAVLNISGWYDEAYGPDGATTNFNGLLAARKNEPNPRTATIIGPWNPTANSSAPKLETVTSVRRRQLTTTKLSFAGWTTTSKDSTIASEKRNPSASLSWAPIRGVTRMRGRSLAQKKHRCT